MRRILYVSLLLTGLLVGSVLPRTVLYADDQDRMMNLVLDALTAGTKEALAVQLLDGSGNPITSFGGTGGTSITDDAAFTPGTTPITPVGGIYRSTLDTVNDGDAGAIAMLSNRILMTHMVDVDGNALAVGGGTQYTEGATDATITGTAMLMEGAGDALVTARGTATDGLLVNLGTNNDVTVTSFAIGGITGTIFDLTNSNPLATQIVDANGTAITAFGGGTQYTEGDTDATITGTALLFEGAANTLVAAPGTAADGLLVNLGSNNDVTITGTATVTATDLDVQSGGADILSTTAFNAAFGTAGTADAQVLSVQGIASMTPLLVGDGAGAFNVIVDSGTITANLGATDNAVLDDIADGIAVTNAGTFAVQVTGSVTVTDGAGALNVICDSGCAGGTQYTEGDTDATITGTALMVEGAANTLVAAPGTAADGLLVNLGTNNDVTVTGTVTVTDGAGALNVIVDSGALTATVTDGAGALNVIVDSSATVTVTDGAGALNVICDSGCSGSGGTSLADDADFTDGTTSGTPIGGVAEAASPTTVTEGDFGWAAITLNRALKVTLYDSTGSELTPSADAEWDVAALNTGPQMFLEAANFDGGALDNVVDTEGDAQLWKGSLHGIGYVMLVSEDGSLQYGTTTTPMVVGDGSGALNIICDSGCSGSGGTSLADDADFTDGTTAGTPIGGVAEDATPSTVTEGDFGWAAITLNRALKVTLYSAAGDELTPSLDGTYDEPFSVNGPTILMDAVDFDGAAFPFAVDAEGDAQFPTVSLSGVQYVMLVSEDGALNYGTSTTPMVVGDGAGALNVICDSGCGSGTQYTEGDTDATITGTALLFEGAANTLVAAPGTAADGLLVNLGANNDVTVTGTVTVTDGSGALNVIIDSSASLTVTATDLDVQSGGADILSTTAFNAAFGTAGTADAQVMSVQGIASMTPLLVNPGTATLFGIYVEDVGETAAGNLMMAGSVRRDTMAASATTTGDNATINTDANGLLWTRQADPCSGLAKSYLPIDIATATTTEITSALAGASTHYYVCSVNLVTDAANEVALVDDDSDGCGSVTSGVAGGTTAAEGWNFAANGGLTLGNGSGSVARTNGTNRVLCLVTSAATQLSGTITVVAAP